MISVEDCQDDHSYIDEQHICIRDSSGQEGACFVISLPSMMDISAVHYPFKKHNITLDKKREFLAIKYSIFLFRVTLVVPWPVLILMETASSQELHPVETAAVSSPLQHFTPELPSSINGYKIICNK